jgi:hypothetical protein
MLVYFTKNLMHLPHIVGFIMATNETGSDGEGANQKSAPLSHLIHGISLEINESKELYQFLVIRNKY